MSAIPSSNKRRTIPELRARKGKSPIVALTAYSALTARFVDPYADFILVGDSLAMVEHGMATTIGASLDMMILHGQSVMRGSEKAAVVIDMPFGSYEASPQEAYHNAVRILSETGCSAVKLEGGSHLAPVIAFLTARGVPVMGHIGLTPQYVQTLGGFKIQGHSSEQQDKIKQDALDFEAAGAFAVVLEGVTEPLAREITDNIAIPTIGIGASSYCDGQVLVLEDMLGFNDKVPRFVKKFAHLGDDIKKAVSDYATAVSNRSFPAEDNIYRPKS
ncbi:3-methyl-2-oxobutanoate hydroxymethyltransferase [Zymomonas mobilis subsp. mobilis NCIMB 11163]|uniref:3-methyl-2-oxobutanoate hydroxymethyltransferase n=1 Tax=Zymomonas mobilis TaxID=542 RepID=UPI0001B7059D|nr:3-methyl-2-oxobutanoate hydroxymethyltransferase [Zymomonas mobilis]ACV75742.1 3-methyl-2-oxobutanoate hydroxymethyltransferase [Zymomonas mobilis subsp. mobilis NCIMB 11163]ART93664.1 3-methyl-2-oxobutanoate hydroxymethyltransferase [Zymomonas mobilis subsp. mobilis]MCP9308426.1 3-methyl-2-oxobutanoate hydroxymethyltransferase [Zymomonas mobilis]TWD60381.1 ketopantoate hydroxymethyltransferase [Zymomonas mobilis]